MPGSAAGRNTPRTQEAEHMDLSYTFDKVEFVLTAVAAGATVLVALELIGLIGGA